MKKRSTDSPKALKRTLDKMKYSGEFSKENKDFAQSCIQKAKEFNDIEAEFEARFVFILNATFLNQEAEALAMFPWLLKKCDESPGKFDYYMTLWAYKWMIDEIPHRAAISMSQIKELQKDFTARYRAYNTGEKVIHYILSKFYNTIGELEKAEKEYQNYLLADSNDVLDDCKACQPNNMIDILVNNGKYETALATAEPILSGKLSCHIVPSSTYASLIYPALALEQKEEAEHFATMAFQEVEWDQSNLLDFAYLSFYYAIKQEFTKALELFQKQLPFSLERISDTDKFHFNLASYYLLNTIKNSGKAKLILDIPQKHHLYQKEQEYELAPFIVRSQKKYQEAASQLDQRNGNHYYQQKAVEKIANFERWQEQL